MPGGMSKINGFKVTWGGKTTAKKTSKKRGQAQLNLLQAIKHNPNWEPTGQPAGLAAMAENEAYRKKPKKKKRG